MENERKPCVIINNSDENCARRFIVREPKKDLEYSAKEENESSRGKERKKRRSFCLKLVDFWYQKFYEQSKN